MPGKDRALRLGCCVLLRSAARLATEDRTLQRSAQWLGQITEGRMNAANVIYGSGPACWLSYDAVLRTAAAGFTNV